MWLIRVGDDTVVESDDFTIEDLEQVEKATGVPWSIANPLKEIKVAKSFLAIAMLKHGIPERDIAATLKTITLRDLKSTFDYKPDDAAISEDGADPTKKPGSTSRASSRGRPLKGGSRPLPDVSESETSSPS